MPNVEKRDIHPHFKIFRGSNYLLSKTDAFTKLLFKKRAGQKFSLTKKIFRQINSLVNYLVKPLLSQNFCQKYVNENFRNFQLSKMCCKNFVKKLFNTKLQCKIFSRKILPLLNNGKLSWNYIRIRFCKKDMMSFWRD